MIINPGQVAFNCSYIICELSAVIRLEQFIFSQYIKYIKELLRNILSSVSIINFDKYLSSKNIFVVLIFAELV